MKGGWTVSGTTQCEGQVLKARYGNKWKKGNVGVQISLYWFEYVERYFIYSILRFNFSASSGESLTGLESS